MMLPRTLALAVLVTLTAAPPAGSTPSNDGDTLTRLAQALEELVEIQRSIVTSQERQDDLRRLEVIAALQTARRNRVDKLEARLRAKREREQDLLERTERMKEELEHLDSQPPKLPSAQTADMERMLRLAGERVTSQEARLKTLRDEQMTILNELSDAKEGLDALEDLLDQGVTELVRSPDRSHAAAANR